MLKNQKGKVDKQLSDMLIFILKQRYWICAFEFIFLILSFGLDVMTGRVLFFLI